MYQPALETFRPAADGFALGRMSRYSKGELKCILEGSPWKREGSVTLVIVEDSKLRFSPIFLRRTVLHSVKKTFGTPSDRGLPTDLVGLTFDFAWALVMGLQFRDFSFPFPALHHKRGG